MNTTQIIFRWIITVLLLRGVYLETGAYTALSIGLIFLAIEIIGMRWGKIIETIILSSHEPKERK